MRNLLHLFAFCLFFPALFGSAAELELELPDGAWVLSSLSPPLGQREGTFTPPEQAMAGRLMPLLNQGEFEQAMEQFRIVFGVYLEDIEAGEVYTPPPPGPPGTPVFIPVSSAMYHMIGHTYLELEQYESAETAFKSALALVPDFARVHEALGFAYLRQERWEEALSSLARAAELGVTNANLFGTLGYLNQQTNNFWGAVSAYQQATTLQPGNAQWQQGLIYSLVQTNQFDSALTLAESLLQQTPDETYLWLFRAHTARQLGDRETALSSLETAIRLGDESLGNLQVASSLHMDIGSVERAVELLDAGLDEGLDFQFFDQALRWLANNEQWESMATLLARADSLEDELFPSQRSLLLTREAALSSNRGDTATASTRLQEAVELDGANAEALMALADLFRDASNYNQADLLYQRASAHERFRENALVSMAQLSIDQNNYSRALTLLRDVVASNPARSDLLRNIEALESLVLTSTQN